MKKSLVSLMLALGTVVSSAQQQPYTASFIGTMGVDTVLVETYTMLYNHLYGKVFTRVPEDYIGQFTVHFYPDGSIREFNMSAMDPSNSSIPFEAKTGAFEYRLSMNCANDSCIFYNAQKGTPNERVYKHSADRMDFVGGWVPVISLMEWNCLRLVQSQLRTLPLHMINHALGVYPIGVHFAGEASRDTIIFGGPFLDYTKIFVDQEGRVTGIDGTGSPWNYTVTKHPAIDVDVMARRMTKTPGIGLPSPEESISKTVHNNNIELKYGRPYKRGRKIFGGVVPYDSVWRTGAGGATTITLGEDIKAGKMSIPKGTYSLYTIPRSNSWQLIFNRNLTRWPTDPDRSKDLVSIDIPVGKLTHTQEQFSISVDETKRGGAINFMWDDTVARFEFATVSK